MKKSHLFLLFLIATIPVITFVGCDLAGITVEARINNFLNDINSDDRSDTYLNFHPTETELYDDLKLSDWESLFPSADRDYYIANLNSLDSSWVTGQIHSPNTLEWPKDVVFVMEKDGFSWYIDDMYLPAGPVPVIY